MKIIGPGDQITPHVNLQVENVGRQTKSKKPWVEDRTTQAHKMSGMKVSGVEMSGARVSGVNMSGISYKDD